MLEETLYGSERPPSKRYLTAAWVSVARCVVLSLLKVSAKTPHYQERWVALAVLQEYALQNFAFEERPVWVEILELGDRVTQNI